MTYCTACGARLTGTAFCGTCGAPTSQGMVGGGHTQPEPDDGKGRIALGWVIAVIILVAGGVTVWWLLPGDPQPQPIAGSTSPPSSPPSKTPSPTPAPTPSTPAPTLGSDWVETFASVQSGVVRIDVEVCDGSTGSGSGFLVGDDLVVTAAHVVGVASDFTVFAEDDWSDGRVIGLDRANDLALVRLDRALTGHEFTFDTEPLVIGEEVAAAGYPLTGELSLTRGAVTAIDLAVEVDAAEVAGVVRTDAVVNPGNSGGPLLRRDGSVAGVVFAKGVDIAVEGFGHALSAEIAAPKARAWASANQSVDVSCPDFVAAPPEDFNLPPDEDLDPPRGGSFGHLPMPSWIVVLESLETDQYTFGDAVMLSVNYDFSLGVVTDVLLSSDFGSLNPGYWVIAVAAFEFEEDAATYCRSIQGVVDNCYQRFLDD